MRVHLLQKKTTKIIKIQIFFQGPTNLFFKQENKAGKRVQFVNINDDIYLFENEKKK